jgi:cysteine desulfurase / selenocysteine lyase
VSYALTWGLEQIRARVSYLAETVRAGLRERPNVTVHDRGPQLSGIVTFVVDHIPASEIRRQLRAAGIHTSICRASHARLDTRSSGLDSVRVSPHYFNTEEEVAELLHALSLP